MRTYFSKFVNRETEQPILDIIGDYCSSWDGFYHRDVGRPNTCYHRLRFFITKRRHIGQIYVEHCFKHCIKDRILKRRYLSSMRWIKIEKPGCFWFQRQMEWMKESLLKKNIDTSFIDKEVERSREPYDFWIRKKTFNGKF